MNRRSHRAGRTAWVVLLLLLLAVAAGLLPEVRELLSRRRLTALLERVGVWAPVVHMLLMASAIIVSPIPTIPLDIVGGILFGPWLGTLYSALGALVGSVAAFLIARRMGKVALETLFKKEICLCVNCSNRGLTWVVFASRLLPMVSFDLISYGAGLTRMSLRSFSLATFFGMLPWTYVYTVFGFQIFDNSVTGFLIGALLAVMFLTLPWLIQRYNLFGLQKYIDIHEQEDRNNEQPTQNQPTQNQPTQNQPNE